MQDGNRSPLRIDVLASRHYASGAVFPVFLGLPTLFGPLGHQQAHWRGF